MGGLRVAVAEVDELADEVVAEAEVGDALAAGLLVAGVHLDEAEVADAP